MFIGLTILTVIGLLLAIPIGFYLSAPGYDGEKSSHFDGTRFQNIGGAEAKGFWDLLKWMATQDQEPWHYRDEVSPLEPRQIVTQPDTNRITFINHATFLIQADSLAILTDPIWSDRASPFQFAGPKRYHEPGIRMNQLPPIDLVLISHNHYDHLDIQTLTALKRRNDPLFIVPLGVDELLRQHDISRVVTLDWWQRHEVGSFGNITAVPAQHFSGRGLFDRDKTLWSGYMIETALSGKRLYFAGDTGYGPFVDEIAQRYDRIDMALLPIGAYKPRWFMQPIHIDPAQAVTMHGDLNVGRSIGMHFGTFPMADDGMNSAREDLIRARKEAGVDADSFTMPNVGQIFTF